jgi:hypothetical protein
MPAPQLILDLIERFERNKEAYKSGAYNETQVRREFIDPFFEALGWDVNNEAGNAEVKTGHEQTLLQRQIDATDKQIDKLVYELYGLTENEIKIVEGQST